LNEMRLWYQIVPDQHASLDYYSVSLLKQ